MSFVSFDTSARRLSQYRTKQGLIFDAENIALCGRYSNEFDAYRARKSWIEILNRYFLLEKERDYEMTVSPSLDEQFFLTCEFSSACGRYAFWRLINHQAPEAEQRLSGGEAPRRGSSTNLLAALLGTSAEENARELDLSDLRTGGLRERKPTLIGEILSQFRKLV